MTLDAEGARREADARDAALARGEPPGPLHGLPMTVKDIYETAGLRTTGGSPALTDHVPDEDAVAVARLRAAGAVIFGKTNTPPMATDWQTANPLFGKTSNPWDPARTPGGSSGGSAAALAAGFTPLELGSDIGGSIRIPSHFCGTVGHKPSWGIVPQRGYLAGPPGWRVESDINVVGPMARTVDDVSLAFDAIVGAAPAHGIAWNLSLPPARRESLGDYRIAAWLDSDHCPLDAGVRAALEAALDALRAAGARVDGAARPAVDLAEAHRLYRTLVAPVMAIALEPALRRAILKGAGDVPEDHPEEISRMARDMGLRHTDWLEADHARQAMRERWADFFRDWDVLLCPVACVAAFPHDLREPMNARRLHVDGRERPYTELWKWMSPFGVALLPASVVPVGRTPEGLPVGIQVVGPFLEDRTCLDVARRIESVLGGFEAPRGWD